MDGEVFRATLFRMEADGLIKLPHGLTPEWPMGTIVTNDVWLATDWNPPTGAAVRTADPNASLRPSYQRVQFYERRHRLEAKRRTIVGTLSAECHRRIYTQYGAADWREEVERRLNGETSPEQDIERERLRARYRALRDGFTALSDDALLAFDPAADDNWAEPDET